MEEFKWNIPEFYNIGVDAVDKWADGSGRLALIDEQSNQETKQYTFDELKDLSNQLANTFKSQGLQKEDRVGVLLPQCVETAISHLATYKLGGIAVPLFSLFGTDALQYRIANASIKVLVTNQEGYAKIQQIKEEIPSVEVIYLISDEPTETTGVKSFWDSLQQASPDFTVEKTKADDPALIIYTSGTTGKPKGACHAQRVLLGHLPGVERSHNYFEGDHTPVMWTPADWAWIGGLLDVLLPAWHHGMTVVACRFEKFTVEATFELMERHQVTHTFLPPTALKMMRLVDKPQEKWNLALKTIASGGESLGKELLEWGENNLNLTINEFYGQTECNMIVSSCSSRFPYKLGSMGKAVPGHNVQIINSAGEILEAFEEGDIAVEAPDPVMFLNYWNNLKETAEKYCGQWLVTGDRGYKDDEGYIFFVGRDDDVITSAGYRIGPGPIEDGLLSHSKVQMVAVVGMPDEARTEIVTAFIVLKEGVEGDEALKKELQDFVKQRVAAHEYPREIHFVEELPMTTTGKVIRKKLREQLKPE